MQFVLVSACLLGSPVRYDGNHKLSGSGILQRWLAEGRVVSVCPEISGGLPVPRPPAEIVSGAGGGNVLSGFAKVVDISNADVTAHFVSGARQALELAKVRGIRVAVLKEGSPSCGSGHIYDGTFSGSKVQGTGVCAALLQSAGVAVFTEYQFLEAHTLLNDLEGESAV